MRRYKLIFALSALLLFCGCSVPPGSGNMPVESAVEAAAEPTSEPTAEPTAEPTPTPTVEPTAEPTPTPTPEPPVEERLLSKMTTEEKVAQLFFVCCPDTGVEELVAGMQPGGLLLFGRDFRDLSREAVTDKLSSYQLQAKIPLLIGTDEEGGTVTRVSGNAALSNARFQSPRDLYAQGGAARVLEAEKEKCALLRSLGVQVNFAPVCDLSDDPSDFMYLRSLGLSAEDTAKMISQIAELYRTEQMGCVLKHFPGYGNAADTHAGIVFDERPLETFQTEDFLPFSAGIDAEAGCVMVAHNIVTCVDAEKPASLSSRWYAILREELGFSGVIITDDLQMGAIAEYTESSSAAVDAILAGCDMLCSSDFSIQYEAVLDAVRTGVIPEARIDESVLRILRWKDTLGLLE